MGKASGGRDLYFSFFSFIGVSLFHGQSARNKYLVAGVHATRLMGLQAPRASGHPGKSRGTSQVAPC